ncbi:MAG TPA: protein kinase [Anaerolineales bacterium]|nr:protein kinase [Anaerolineales bacterium]
MQPEKIGIYEVKAELGRGGMATVYRAYDPRFEREVAVKVLPSELLHSDPQFRLRFEREAKIIAQLEHTAIVPVYDVGEADGQPYFVMRYMNGGSLSERIKAGGLTIEDAARILSAIAPGLDEAHSKGIVHRDIKPSNILFDKRGNPYISDFGIAKLSQAQSGNVTGSAIIGTPAYMSPEQAQGTQVDGRADIYALGIILFEMLTGQQPYQADTPMAVAIKHITDPVPQIRKIKPQLSEGVDTVIQKAMAKDKNSRFATAVEMTTALQEVARYEPTKLQTKSAFPTVKTKVKIAPQKKGFNALLVILPVLALGVVAVIAAGFFVFNGGLSPAKTEVPISTSTTIVLNTETSVPTDAPTGFPIAVEETASTDTPPAPTDTAKPSVSSLGGADKIAFVANNEIWLVNVDGTNLKQLTTDGGAKNDLQWLPNSETILFISGKTIKYYNVETDVVDTLATFPAAASLEDFQVSHDGKRAMVSLNNEIFVIPFDLEQVKGISKKSDLLALEPCIVPKGKTRSALQVKETRWSADDKLVAWLYKELQSDQVSVFDINACDPEKIDLLDNFPGTRFEPIGFQSRIIPDFDWDGSSLFSFNTSRRNNGWGELYVYNWESHKPTLLHPVSNKCCYRDARWSPDGTYFLFAFQDESLAASSQTFLYYVPYGEIGTGANMTPIPLPEGFFKNLKEAPQAALHPAQ